MRALTAALALTLVCGMAAPALAFGLPGGDDPAVTRVHEQQTVLHKQTYAAAIAVLDSVVLLQKAAGDEAEAARIVEVAKKLKAGDAADPAALAAAHSEVKAIANKLAATEFPSRALSEDEKGWLQEAMTTLGAAGMADMHVAKAAVGLTGELVKAGQANPMALMKIKDETTAIKTVSELATEQAATIKTIYQAVGRFAKSHHVAPPTREQIEKAYKALKG